MTTQKRKLTGILKIISSNTIIHSMLTRSIFTTRHTMKRLNRWILMKIVKRILKVIKMKSREINQCSIFVLFVVIFSCTNHNIANPIHQIPQNYELNECIQQALQSIEINDNRVCLLNETDSIICQVRGVMIDPWINYEFEARESMDSIVLNSNFLQVNLDLKEMKLFSQWLIISSDSVLKRGYIIEPNLVGLTQVIFDSTFCKLSLGIREYGSRGRLYGFVFKKNHNEWLLIERKLIYTV